MSHHLPQGETKHDSAHLGQSVAWLYVAGCPGCRTQVGGVVKTTCPTCEAIVVLTVYDVGSGPELSCPNCEWCWGAHGQALKPLTLGDIARTDATLPDFIQERNER